MKKDFTNDFEDPCICDTCWNWERCKIEKMACRDFTWYVQDGRQYMADREPSKKLYNRIFSEDDG